jgi:hypothetical protein
MIPRDMQTQTRRRDSGSSDKKEQLLLGASEPSLIPIACSVVTNPIPKQRKQLLAL